MSGSWLAGSVRRTRARQYRLSWRNFVRGQDNWTGRYWEFTQQIGGLGLGDVSLQEFGAPDTALIRVQRQEGGDDAQKIAVDRIKEALVGSVAEYRRTEFVGPTVSAELKRSRDLGGACSSRGNSVVHLVPF